MIASYILFLPLFLVFTIAAARRRASQQRARLLQEHALHDQQRFLRMGFLRRRAREDEQRSGRMNFLRKEAR
jgi:hypothetical protein